MRQARIEDRVRDFVAAERAHIPAPPILAYRILRAVEASQPARSRPRLGFLRVAAAMAGLLILGAAVAWVRLAERPARSAAGLVEGTWSATLAMAQGRGYHTATLLPNGKVLVVGGSGFFVSLSDAELYDPKTHRWSSAGKLQTPRWWHTATLLKNGKVLVVGGTSAPPAVPDQFASISSTELYDPQTNRWSPAANMLTARCFHTATLLDDGRVLVAGGYQSLSETSGRVLATTEVYDPTSNTWTSAGSMPAPRAMQSAILLADHRVLVIGGAVGDWNSLGRPWPPPPQRTAELYDPSAGSWSSAESMHATRILPATSLLPDGRVLVVGDVGLNEQSAEVFDPSSAHWSSIKKPAVGHAEAVGVALHNGNILVAGGVGETSAEVFDWHHNTWSSAGAMTAIRSAATATVLSNGQVLVAGGFGNRSRPWASAELYDPTGSRALAVTKSTSAPVLVIGLGPPLAIAAFLLAFVFWFARRRHPIWPNHGDGWIDPQV